MGGSLAAMGKGRMGAWPHSSTPIPVILLLSIIIQVKSMGIPLLDAGPDSPSGGSQFRGLTFGKQKRNFDEIDRSGFAGFVKRRPEKKNFDEMDRFGFDGFVKRPFYQKKNFDEIDRVGFGGFGRAF